MAGDKPLLSAEQLLVDYERYFAMRGKNRDAVQRELALRDQVLERLNSHDSLVEALEAAESHIAELREAWQRGAIAEYDGQGGTRSNRNADIHRQIQSALAGRKP